MSHSKSNNIYLKKLNLYTFFLWFKKFSDLLILNSLNCFKNTKNQ